MLTKLGPLYLKCAKQASKGFIQNWVVIIGMIASYFTFSIVGQFIQPLGVAGGFILGMLMVGLLSLYYFWLQKTIDGEKLKFKGLLDFDSGLFFHVISIAFIFWIVLDLILGSVAQGTGDITVTLVAQLGSFLLFNAIPEILYQRRIDGMDALIECFNFIKENWIEWFIPLLVILVFPLSMLPGDLILTSLAQSNPMLPFGLIFQTVPAAGYVSGIISGTGILGSVIIPLFICHWFMLFRGFLFDAIESGSLRR